jgi:hypothetical protein
MIRRTPLPPQSEVSISPRRRPGLPAALLLGSLLALAGCGQDDQHVAETYPSGARPAPQPTVPASTAQVQLPPPPPAEPSFPPPPI